MTTKTLTTAEIAALRTGLTDTITELLHLHGGDRSAVLAELGVSLQQADGNHAGEKDEPHTTAPASAEDLHDERTAMYAGLGIPRLVELADEQYRGLCGIVQCSWATGHMGAGADWEGLRTVFPAADYLAPTEPEQTLVEVVVTVSARRHDDACELGYDAIDPYTDEDDEYAILILGADRNPDGTWAVTGRALVYAEGLLALQQQTDETFTVVTPATA